MIEYNDIDATRCPWQARASIRLGGITEEIFGPMVCAQPFDDDDLDRVAKEANDTIYGLAASVWTRNIGTAHKLASRIRSSMVWIKLPQRV